MIARFVGGVRDGEEQEIAEPAPFQINAIEHPEAVTHFQSEPIGVDLRPFRTITYQLTGRPQGGFAYYEVVR